MEPRQHHTDKAVGADTSPRSSQAGSSEKSGPVGRIANESRALIEDLRDWVDLRVQLIQVDVEERIERAANELFSLMLVMVMALFTGVFLLHGLAVWLGSALGGTHWGYLIVGALLAGMTLLVRKARPNHLRHMASMYQPELPAAKPGKAEAPPALARGAAQDSAEPGIGKEKGGEERG
ncbi:MAG: phage holin family protein [Bacteroidetes bacterium]|nr:phage holin family protein [Bacteroidota bacterium]MDA0874115.1 phage holin family protein [Bacteroidota bacterium]